MVTQQPPQLHVGVLSMAKKSSRHMFIVLVVALLISILLVSVIALKPMPRLMWNASESVPIGLYWIEYRQPNLGEIAVLKPPEWVQLIADKIGRAHV